MQNEFVEGAFSLLALGCLIGLFFTAWQSIIVDAVRQRLFEIRDNTLLWAFDNGQLEDEGYKDFRDMVNKTIRHFESMSLMKIIIIHKLFDLDKSKKNGTEVKFQKNKHLMTQFQKVVRVCMQGTIIRSPIGMAFVTLSFPFVLLSIILNGKVMFASNQVKEIEGEVRADILACA